MLRRRFDRQHSIQTDLPAAQENSIFIQSDVRISIKFDYRISPYPNLISKLPLAKRACYFADEMRVF
jgi:hypothetical protein